MLDFPALLKALQKVPKDVLLTAGLAGLGAGLVTFLLVLYVCRSPPAKDEDEYNGRLLPPVAPASPWEVLKNLTSAPLPWFLLENSKLVGPVYRFKSYNWKLPGVDSAHNKAPYVVVGDPILAREILTDPLSFKTPWIYMSTDFLSSKPNMFTGEGDRWRKARSRLIKSYSNLDNMSQVIQSNLEHWIAKRLEPCAELGESIDILQEMMVLTVQVISEAALGYKMCRDSNEDQAQQFLDNVKCAQIANSPFRDTFFAPFLPSVRKARNAVANLNVLAQTMLDHYRETHKSATKEQGEEAKPKEEEKPASSDKKESKSKKTKAKAAKAPAKKQEPAPTMMQCIVENEYYESDKDRLVDILILLTAGYDMTASTVAWTLLELARRPKQQKELRKELQAKLNSGLPPGPLLTSLSHLADFQNMLQESMRLMPAAGNGVYRTVVRDFKYTRPNPSGDPIDYVIPAGSTVNVVPLCLHRNPEAYPDRPEEFCPARWSKPTKTQAKTVLDEQKPETCDLQDAAFQPFSLGRRNCVGQVLAVAELTLVVARLVAEYEWTVEELGTADFFVTLKPKGTLLKAKRVKKTG